MDGASPATNGGHIALALAAGTIVTKKESVAPAIRDRCQALRRAISSKSAAIKLQPIDEDPASEAHRATLAKDLDDRGASNDRDVVTTARELLALIRVDEAARTAIDTMIGEVEAALIKLSAVDVEGGEAAPAEEKKVEASQASQRGSSRNVAESKRDLRSETGSRRVIPPEEPSKTELERTALPIWKRTDRFFTKGLILIGAYVALGIVAWLALRTPPNESMERCRGGDKARCWEVVAAEDAVEQGHKVSSEPLRLLCDRHQDSCACAGLAYVNAAETEQTPDCNGLSAASALDPTWPCQCKRYDFWRWGQQRTSHCGIPRCE
jgi:hypothetical protein